LEEQPGVIDLANIQREKDTMKKSRFLLIAAVIMFKSFLTQGCAFTAKPVYLIEKPDSSQTLIKNNMKVALIVHDARAEFYQKLRYFGKVKNSYGMTTSFVFLVNLDTIDKIVALHAERIFTRSGYAVSNVYPQPATTISAKLSDTPKKDKRASKEFPPELFDPRASNSQWLNDCQAVIYIEIKDCDTGFLQAFFTVEVHSNIDIKLSVQDITPARNVFFSKFIKGIGTSGPRAIISEESYNVSVNMAYWVALANLKKTIRSPEFKEAIYKARAASTISSPISRTKDTLIEEKIVSNKAGMAVANPNQETPVLAKSTYAAQGTSGYDDIAEADVLQQEGVRAERKLNHNEPKEDSITEGGMAKIPAGWFMIGCSTGDPECKDDEKPSKHIYIDSFYMDAYEVTQAEYQRIMGENPSHFKDCFDCPVRKVTWHDARDYCEKVGKRLPTEAEWEYAARGGTSSARYGDLDSIAWYGSNSGGKTHPVGQKQPNAYGLYDMLGNVWEWCEDSYDKDWYSQVPENNSINRANASFRVVRGGCWSFDPKFIRLSIRGRFGPTNWNNVIGFRCSQD
jgi:formylglycine-generating enzyme required for sulfatase activity